MSINPCIIGTGFLGATIYTKMAKEDDPVFQEYRASLNQYQLEIYERIKAERLSLYLQGLAFGFAVAFLNYYFNKSSNDFLNKCLFLVITMTICTFYYLLMPKSTHMVKHLTSRNQVDKWHAVYKEMQRRYYLGFGIGLAGYIAINYVMKTYF